MATPDRINIVRQLWIDVLLRHLKRADVVFLEHAVQVPLIVFCSFIEILALVKRSCLELARCILPHILASVLITGVLQTEQPLVILIPAVVCLVLGGKPRTTWGGAYIFDYLDSSLLLIGELNWSC